MSEYNNTSGQETEDEISLLDLLQTVVENLRLLVLGPLLVGSTVLGLSYFITPTYTASTQFMPPQQQQSGAAAMLQSLGSISGLAGAATGIKNPNDQYVSLLKSRSLQDAIVERFHLMKRYESKFPDEARSTLAGVTLVTSGKDGLIQVSVSDRDPAFAAELANAHVQELTLLLGRLAVTEAQQRRLFFEKQLQETKDQLTKAEQALQASGVNASSLKINPQAAVAGLARLQAAISAQEVKVASMRGYLTESAPDFRQALTELTALRAQLQQSEKAQAPTPNGDSDYVAKFRDFKYYETLYELFSKQYELARVDESREGVVIQVVDVAQTPRLKSKPKRALMAVMATLASGFVLLLFVFARQAVRNAAQDADSAAKLQRLRAAWNRALGRRAASVN